MGHVDTSFKGYQPYEFTYIRDLAEPKHLKTESKKKAAATPAPSGAEAPAKDTKDAEDKDE